MPFYSFRNLVISFGITIAVVLLILLYTFSTHLSEKKALGNIQIAREGLQKLESALLNIQEFEYSLNSFVFSGGEQQSNFYTSGSLKLVNDSIGLAEIANSDSTKKNAADYKRLANLSHQMKDYAAFIVGVYKTNGAEAARGELKKGNHTSIIPAFKTLVEELETNNREILSKSYNRSITLARQTFIFAGVISVLLILILAISFWLGYKDIMNRISYHQKLVEDVNKKTAEISNVFERVTDAFVALDKKWQYIYVNEKAAIMHGRKAQDLIGKNIWTEFPDVVNEPFYDALHEAMEKQKPRRLQLYYSTTDKWFEDLIYPSHDGVSVYYHDITEKKKVEIKLAESEEKYRTVIEQASDGIFIADKNSFIIDANNHGCSMLGYSKEDLLKMKFTELISPENIRTDPVKYDELRSGNTVRSERKLLRKDGSEILVDISAKMLSDGRFQSIARDITDRKKAEEDLQRSNNRFELITRTTNDAVWEWNLETGELWANEMHQHLYGLAPSDLVPTVDAWTEKIHPDDRLEILKRQKESLASDKNVFISEYRFNVEGKGYRDIYDRCYIVRNNEGKPIRMMGSMMDITERKRAQQQIEKEKTLSDSIINGLPGVFYLFDETYKYIRWNKNKEIYTGYTAEEISNMSPLDFFGGEEKELIRQTIEEGFTQGKLAVEAHFVHKSGKRIPFYFTGIVVEYEEKRCLLGMGIDITERKKAQDELEQSYSAIRHLTDHLQHIREEERIHIAREIHDELGQQLTVMKMDLSWLNKKVLPDDELVKQKLKSLTEMLDGTVKSVRRISSELRPSLLDDMGLVAAMEWQLSEFEKRSGIKTTLSVPGVERKLPDSIKTGLFRIFQESLTNIAKHAHANHVKVNLQHTSDKIVLSIEDDGKGYDKKKATSNRTLGILGMKERTLMMGGEYEINSSPGKGTTVLVAIPEQNLNSQT